MAENENKSENEKTENTVVDTDIERVAHDLQLIPVATAAVSDGDPLKNEELPIPPSAPPPPPRLTTTTLLDRSLYRGQVDSNLQPHGNGVVYPALGTHVYGGAFRDAHKDGLGVQLLPNGTLYAGDFQDDYASGHGVKRDPFGSQFIGQWSEGEFHGRGLSVDVDGQVSWGRFLLNELDDTATSSSDIEWPQVQHTVLQALLAEQNAIQSQERARQAELDAALQSLTTIGSQHFVSSDQIATFLSHEDHELQLFLQETQRQYDEVETESDRWKFQEAQLKETQKNLRREINGKRTELSFLAKYVALADERHAQVTDSERVLQSLHRQIELLQLQVSRAMGDDDGAVSSAAATGANAEGIAQGIEYSDARALSPEAASEHEPEAGQNATLNLPFSTNPTAPDPV